MRSDQLQERSARANSSSSSSSVLLLLLCDTESLLWRDSCECTPPPLDRERESGGRAALARSWRPGRARSRDRDRDRESWQCGTAHLLESMSLSALHPKSAARVASRNSKMTEAVAVRLVLPHSPKTHTLSLSLPNRLYFILGEAQIQTVLGISPSLRRPVIERVHSDQPSPASFHRLVCTRSARTRISGWIEIPSSNGNKGSRERGSLLQGSLMRKGGEEADTLSRRASLDARRSECA